jgi:thiamine kinase-like enzyme
MMENPLPPRVKDVIAHIPMWRDKELQIKPLEGLTNTNYEVTVDAERFVLRFSGPNAAFLGIDRELERNALLVASQAGIGPDVVYFGLPEGHLVTRFIDGHHLELAEFRTRGNLQRIVETLKHLHSLPPVTATFSPFRRVEKYAAKARVMDVSLPPDYDRFIQIMGAIEREQANDPFPWRRFCHNDLFCVNVMDDGKFRFIDWEFAGMGDLYYDLATLTYAYDSPDTLSPELQDYVLACYFGEVSNQNRIRLSGMKYMLMFFSAMWGLLQQGLQNRCLVRVVEGFNFMEYANTTFETMRQHFVNHQDLHV